MGCEHHIEAQIDPDAALQWCCVHHFGKHNSCSHDPYCKSSITFSPTPTQAHADCSFSLAQTAPSAAAYGLVARHLLPSLSPIYPSSILCSDNWPKPSDLAPSWASRANQDRKATHCKMVPASRTGEARFGKRTQTRSQPQTAPRGPVTSTYCLPVVLRI
jgi:hypothetical protein